MISRHLPFEEAEAGDSLQLDRKPLVMAPRFPPVHLSLASLRQPVAPSELLQVITLVHLRLVLSLSLVVQLEGSAVDVPM
jgi:hypothetical protein